MRHCQQSKQFTKEKKYLWTSDQSNLAGEEVETELKLPGRQFIGEDICRLVTWFPPDRRQNYKIGLKFNVEFHWTKCGKLKHTKSFCLEKLLFSIRIRGERILFFGPNTNTNNIWNQILDRIRIRIIFVFSEWANTNMNNIRAILFGWIRIRIIFRFRIVPEYEYE